MFWGTSDANVVVAIAVAHQADHHTRNQRARSSEQAASEQAASEQAAPSTEQEREASSEKRPGNRVRAGSSEQAATTARDGVVEWSEWLLPTPEQELANRLGIDSCFKCKGKDWELVSRVMIVGN